MAMTQSETARSQRANQPENQQTIDLLQQAYMKELETVSNYLAASVNLDGIRAEEIKRVLADDVGEELGHARQLAQRIKQLGGIVPGSMNLEFSQQTLQPSQKTTDLQAVIEGVLDAENDAINRYREIIRVTDGRDYVTADLVTQILADEEEHRVLFEGFLAEIHEE